MDHPSPGISFEAEVVEVIDGDTVEVETRLRHRVRLQDCWAKETTLRNGTTPGEKAEGLRAEAYLKDFLQECSNKVMVWIPGNGGDLKKVSTLSRLIGRIWRRGDTQDVSSHMVAAGHATATKDKQ